MVIRSLLPVSGAAMLGALLAAVLPVHLHSVDRAGAPIPCGDSFRPSYEVARGLDRLNSDQHATGGPMFFESDYAAQCEALVSRRRVASASVGVVGGCLALTAVCVWQYRRRPQYPKRDLARDFAPDDQGLNLGSLAGI